MGILSESNVTQTEQTIAAAVKAEFVAQMPVNSELPDKTKQQIEENINTLAEALSQAVLKALRPTLEHINQQAVVTGNIADVPLQDGRVE